MTRAEKELDDFGNKALRPLRSTLPLDPKVMEQEKARFLLHGQNLRDGLIPNIELENIKQAENKFFALRRKFSLPVYKALAISILVLLFVAASSFTVFAAQSSLPGDPLYTVKSVSEDLRLSLALSPEAKLNLTLDYTNRRMGEIRSLAAHGKSFPDQTSDRYQQELDDALQLAAQLDDQQIQNALNEIKIQAENQGMTAEELIASLPNQASPAIINLLARLKEQVQWSTLGEKNPHEFRSEMKARAHNRHGPKAEPDTDESPATGPKKSFPTQQDSGSGGWMSQPTGMPGHGNSGNGQGSSSPGNGNHGPNPTHTPKP